MENARRDSTPPSGVRAPLLTVAPSAAGALGSPADFGRPRPPVFPGRPHSDALRLSSPHPRPPCARAHPPAPHSNVHAVPPPPPHSPAPPLSSSEAPEVGCRGRRRTAALRTRGPPARGAGPGLAPLPPATRIMASHVSHLFPYAPCVMAASGLFLPSPTPKPHGEGRRPLGGAPRTPVAAPPDWRVVGPAGARLEPLPSSMQLPRPLDPPPCPPPVPHPSWGGAARACDSNLRRPLLHCTGSAGGQESGGIPRCPKRAPPRQPALNAHRRLAGCCAGGTRRPRASYPPPTGVCTHGTGHRPLLRGSHTTTHHSTMATGGRE